ncbi:MAG: ABC transporter substrate-binding protein [Vicingaceae bacterium]
MRNIAIFSFVAALILTSCGGDSNNGNKNNKKANGDVAYGGVFRLNETEDPRSFYPLNITEVVSHRITNQIYEGLVKLNQEDLTVEPCLAERWDINEDATVFTFYLRKGVKFHDDQCFPEGKGREVKAQDVKYCLDRACTSFPENQMFWLFKDKLKGANEYFESTKNGTPLAEGVEGVKVIDDYTIQVELDYPFAGFLNIMSHPAAWVYPKEAVDTYGIDMRINCVGTGPFKIKNLKEGEAVILERNPNYWGVDEYGNQLPYLDAIKVSFIKEKKTELLEFRKGNLDMVFRLPLEMIKDVVGELEDAKKGGNTPFVMQVVPAMSVYYFGFQNKLPPFDNKKVRQAFNYAIDRDKIVNYTLQGEGRPANHGIVPPFKGYDYENVKGYTYDPEKAKTLLAEAGYPNGKGFPAITLQINSGGGDRNVQTAEVIQKMLQENLNVSVNIEIMQFAQHLENLETGKALFWRTGWVADYPDPENFLNLLYGKHVPDDINTKSYINSVRYQSPIFDSLFETALREIDFKKRMELFRQADQVAIDDAAVMPIFYDENTRLLQEHVKNFPANAMEYRDFSEVYFKYPEKDKK